MDNIIYTTPEQQIDKLKSQHLTITDEDAAKNILSVFGYSNLIKSYREPYLIISNGQKVYRSDVTFDQIVSLYLLDKELRNAVMAAMLDLEEHIKETAADVIASNFGTHQDDYLQYKNYANKKKRKTRFSLPAILSKMNETLLTDKNPICHYRESHGIVPPWILFKSIYFSTIINFIDQFKVAQKNNLANKLYDLSSLNISEDDSRLVMMDTLFLCLEYRNLAAHGGRTYNYKSNYALRTADIFDSDSNSISADFSFLLFLLSLLKYQHPYEQLTTVLSREVNRHCQNYPQDVTYLAQILNVDIRPHNPVYISGSSNKFHADPHCSGLTNPLELELEDAVENGYVPCKRCIDSKYEFYISHI